MHHFEKMLPASRGFVPTPTPGSCPWTLLGDFRPLDPLIANPWPLKKNSTGAHRIVVSVLVLVSKLVASGSVSISNVQVSLTSLPLPENRSLQPLAKRVQ